MVSGESEKEDKGRVYKDVEKEGERERSRSPILVELR